MKEDEAKRYNFYAEIHPAIESIYVEDEVDIMAIAGPTQYEAYQELPEYDDSKDFVQMYAWATITNDQDQIVQLIRYAVDNGFTIIFQNTKKKQKVPNGVGREQRIAGQLIYR